MIEMKPTVIGKPDDIENSKARQEKIKAPKVEGINKTKRNPDITLEVKDIPDSLPNDIKDIPVDYNIDNTIFIKGTPIELKPTLLMYFRNGATDCFGALRAIPIGDFVNIPAGVINKDYSGDELLYRFLYAAFDGNPLFKKNYNTLSAGDINKIIDIFGRLNGIFEREEEAKRKKAEQQLTKA